MDVRSDAFGLFLDAHSLFIWLGGQEVKGFCGGLTLRLQGVGVPLLRKLKTCFTARHR